MKKLFASLFISFAICHYADAQLSFVRDTSVQVIDDSLPLKNAWAGGLNYPMVEPIDLNGDGIMDLILFEPSFPPGGSPGHTRIIPFINYGDSGKVDYHFAPDYIPLFPYFTSWLVTYDYNCDGKMDLFGLSDFCNCGIMVYRNDYTPGGGLKFTLIADPVLSYYYGTQQFNISANSAQVPAFADVDGDGDMDILEWPAGVTTTLSYYQGLAVDSGLSCDSLRLNQAIPACWAHFALTQGANLASLGLECRLMKPDSASLGDVGAAVQDDTQSCICIYEQDSVISNRNKDLLIGGYADNNMIYLHNGGPATNDSMDYEDYDWPVYNVPVNMPSFPCAYNLDVDNDGRKDMIITPHSVSDYRGILNYKNVDIPDDTPIFARQPHTFLQEEMIEVGTAAAPQFFDYDCDGLPDLLVGDMSYYDTSGATNKGIALYKNIGTSSMPKFKLITRDFAGINELNGLSGTFCSTFGDLNKDGYIDMITGSGDGKLYYFQNNGCPASFTSPTGNYMGIDVGEYSAPQLYDLNHDGKLDLIVGNKAGLIKYYQNTGTDTVPVFDSIPTIDTLGGILLYRLGGIEALSDTNLHSGYASPYFFNDSGIDKLILGTQIGKLYIFDGINGNIHGTYHLADSLINGEEGQNLVPAIADINNDGRPDMIIGNYNGGVSLFMNKFTTVGINEANKIVHPSFDAYPNPVSGELHIDFYHLESTPSHFEIVNCIGQTVYNTTVTENQMTISLKNLASGIYLARFMSADNAQSLKIIVRR